MKYYAIGGLGADHRIFKNLKINTQISNIRWIDPIQNESLKRYAERISIQIDKTEKYSFIGVSFGGIIAIELSKFMKPEKIILISSVITSEQLPSILKISKKLGLLNILTKRKPPIFISTFLFGTKNKSLLNSIINDTDIAFFKWAINQIANWDNDIIPSSILRIHGTNDKLIPLKGDAIKIAKAGHFMIVDKAEEISKIIKEDMSHKG